ncbi:hypothetical protein PPL_01777 [Heterostelium album PN500]|uniref:F-box domain-containing protein n=1 Tax=Heterostelium pallidum (strain ATCC 26659 / Pp 5 / PN500) TaxID=670386 RepID=D3B0G0_HETP5|nr:hypothetical protein PPL_01777 [Heterostelium album PN500]EFA84784.1 hypothetical protein PPL_01777 [Heterostelium album PN500]|eukprot:XP_020436896.1 hypothetical protein PPL_01777 [Heterostelium album PN500]
MGVATSKENNKYLRNLIKISDLPEMEQRQFEKKQTKTKKTKSRARSLSLALPSTFRPYGSRASTIIKSDSLRMESDLLPLYPAQQQQQKPKDRDRFNYISTQYIVDQSQSTTLNFILPDIVIKNIISYAVGNTFPSKNFNSVSLVCRAWWRMSFQSVTSIYYHFPYIYEKESDIRRCKLIARWLSTSNHYDQTNQIDSVSVERMKAISTLLAENTGIRRLDMSYNLVPIQAIGPLISVFHNGQGGLRELVWRDAALQDTHLESILRALQNSQVFHLNLSGNALDSDNPEIFSSILANLSKPSRLTSIDLSLNEFSFEAVRQIIEACRKNHRLKRLKLVGNILSDEQTAELKYDIEKLKVQKTLRRGQN